MTQFDGERALVHKVLIEGEKPLFATSKSDYTSVSLKDLIPEQEITATQRVSKLKVNIKKMASFLIETRNFRVSREAQLKRRTWKLSLIQKIKK